MAKKKKKKKSNPETTERNKKIMLIAAVVLGTAGVFVSAGMGIKVLDERASELIVQDDPEIHIQWGQGASGHIWMPIAERERIQARVEAATSGTKALSWHPLYQATKALQATGWINETPTARWTEQGSIEIVANWRVPAAAVRVGDRDYIIDYDANVLPLDYPIDQSNQIVIHHPALPNPGVANTWNEPEIHDALRLMTELKENNILAQVIGVDLGTGRDHGVLSLLTNGNAQIVWGGGPGRDRPAEMPSSVKMQRLVSLFNKTGRIDAGLQIVDIRGQDILTQRHEN
ncbi:MAG: hypothetical protein AB8C13_07690 [Phycisphaerales bacterium]